MTAILALLVAVSLRAETVKNPDTFVLAQPDEVTSLDPVYPYDNASQSLIFNIYDTLIRFKGASLTEFEPGLAEKIPSRANGLISADGLTYTFPLRKGVRFHDGGEMTPEDVRYSLMRFMLSDRAGGPSALLLEPLLGVTSTRDSSGTIKVEFTDVEKAVSVPAGSRQIVVRLKRPFGPFLSVMARWSYVMSKAWAAANGEWDGQDETWKSFNNPSQEKSFFFNHMNGTGPFMLERWDRTAKYILLKRHEAHWRGKASLERVLVKTVPEVSTRKLMLQAGDADLVDTPRPFVSQFAGLPGVVVRDGLTRLSTDPSFYFTFKINTTANPDIGSGGLDGSGIPPDFFNDVDVRKGFSFAMDYEALRRDTFKGTAKRAKGPIPPGLAGYDADQPFYSYDLAKAEKHFRKAWGGKVWREGFRFTMTYNTGSENREAACQILKKNVESLNPLFRIDLRGLDWSTYLDKAQKRLMPVFTRGWEADYPDGHNFVYAYYHSNGRYPSAQGYSHPELDRLIEAAGGETVPKKRNELYKKILRLGYEEAPSIVTVHRSGVYAMREWVKGFYDNPVNLGIDYYPLRKQ